MNSYFRPRLAQPWIWLQMSVLVLFLLSAPQTHAVYLNGIYTGACKRDLGLILSTEDQAITFLTVEGKLERIPRHQIIYIANYPMDHFPALKDVATRGLDATIIYTRQNGDIKILLTGWPINYSKDKVAFFTVDGYETVIDRDSIWRIEKTPFNGVIRVRTKEIPQFGHPYAFRDCPLAKGHSDKRLIYPEQVLADPITIKRQLDELSMGQTGLQRYVREQKFYPKPEIYGNSTSLGIWENLGSRYGASSRRSNNILPNLVDSYSSELFDYQRVFVTGSAPMDFAVHEEAQSQITYRFKASYFHFTSMIDPNIVLVGKGYPWSEEDLEDTDDRLNDSTLVEFGFDYGSWAFQIYVVDMLNGGVRYKDQFEPFTISLPRFGLKYQTGDWLAELSSGTALSNVSNNPPEVIQAAVTRLNLGYELSAKWDIGYSLIQRQLNVSMVGIKYNSHSITNYVEALYEINKRYTAGGYLSLENHKSDAGYTIANQSQTKNHLKLGGYFSLKF